MSIQLSPTPLRPYILPSNHPCSFIHAKTGATMQRSPGVRVVPPTILRSAAPPRSPPVPRDLTRGGAPKKSRKQRCVCTGRGPSFWPRYDVSGPMNTNVAPSLQIRSGRCAQIGATDHEGLGRAERFCKKMNRSRGYPGSRRSGRSGVGRTGGGPRGPGGGRAAVGRGAGVGGSHRVVEEFCRDWGAGYR